MSTFKISWYVLCSFAVAALAVGFIDQGLTLNKISQALTEKNHHESMAASLIGSAADNEKFMRTLSPREAVMWTMLAREAEENPNATGIQELWTTSSAYGVPVIVNFRDNYGVSYTAAIGTVVHLREGGKRFEPALVFYQGNPEDGLVRVEKFDPSTAEYRVLNEWKKSQNIDFTLFAKSLKQATEQHLHLAQNDG